MNILFECLVEIQSLGVVMINLKKCTDVILIKSRIKIFIDDVQGHTSVSLMENDILCLKPWKMSLIKFSALSPRHLKSTCHFHTSFRIVKQESTGFSMQAIMNSC